MPIEYAFKQRDQMKRQIDNIKYLIRNENTGKESNKFQTTCDKVYAVIKSSVLEAQDLGFGRFFSDTL